MAACGGDDDDAAATTTDAPVVTAAPTTTTTAPPATTTTTTLPPLELVTEGATVIVANASGINGSAGRMSDQLEAVGFTMGEATNSSESQLEVSKVYHDPDNPDALAVAESVALALGGGDIEVLELTVPAPLSDPDSIGDATVLLAMGNDTADKSLDELQGRVAPTPEPDEGTDEQTGEDTGDESTGDESTGDEGTGEATGDESTGDATSDG